MAFWIIFVWPRRFAIFDHNTLPVFIALRFVLVAPILQIEVLCLTSNFFANLRSDFLVLIFLLDTYVLGVIGLLSVHPSGVETIYASIIALCCCWSSHLPAFFITSWFFTDIYVHKKNCYLMIDQPQWQLFVFTVVWTCNNPIIITQCFSNESISNIAFRTFIIRAS